MNCRLGHFKPAAHVNKTEYCGVGITRPEEKRKKRSLREEFRGRQCSSLLFWGPEYKFVSNINLLLWMYTIGQGVWRNLHSPTNYLLLLWSCIEIRPKVKFFSKANFTLLRRKNVASLNHWESPLGAIREVGSDVRMLGLGEAVYAEDCIVKMLVFDFWNRAVVECTATGSHLYHYKAHINLL